MTALAASQLLAAALLPPFSLVILLVAGLVLVTRWRRLGTGLIAFATFALYTLSTPWAGGALLKSLEISAPLTLAELRAADAVVVLGAGRYLNAPEYGGDTLKGLSLERLRYGVRLHRASGLPLLVTGGKPGGGLRSEGELMREILENEYRVSPHWVEDGALTTWDNARLAAPLLRADGAKRIVLVSHAWHLRRAVPLFEAQGFEVVPAGIGFSQHRANDFMAFVPLPEGMRDSHFALHEWVGILWYKLRSLSEGSP